MQIEVIKPKPVPVTVVLTLTEREAKSLKWALLNVQRRGRTDDGNGKWVSDVWDNITALHAALEAKVPGVD